MKLTPTEKIDQILDMAYPPQNIYIALRLDGWTDIVAFNTAEEAEEFCELHPEYGVEFARVFSSVKQAHRCHFGA